MEFFFNLFGRRRNKVDGDSYQQYPGNEPPQQLPGDDNDDFGFRVFGGNPLEMHQHFERQMNEILRTFGFSEGLGGFFNGPNLSGIDDHSFNHPDTQGRSLRDHFLRPDNGHFDNGVRGDATIEGRIDLNELDKIMSGDDKQQNHGSRMMPSTNTFFGQSFSSKTVTSPDGTVEIRRTKRDSEGNEETTITKRLGDKEYSVTTRRDASGKTETHENIINMNESEVDNFKNKPIPYRPKETKNPDFDFMKFFGPKM